MISSGCKRRHRRRAPRRAAWHRAASGLRGGGRLLEHRAQLPISTLQRASRNPKPDYIDGGSAHQHQLTQMWQLASTGTRQRGYPRGSRRESGCLPMSVEKWGGPAGSERAEHHQVACAPGQIFWSRSTPPAAPSAMDDMVRRPESHHRSLTDGWMGAVTIGCLVVGRREPRRLCYGDGVRAQGAGCPERASIRSVVAICDRDK